MFAIRMKEWKKRLRRNRRNLLYLGVWLAAVLTALTGLSLVLRHGEEAGGLPPADSAITVWADDRAQAVSFDAPDSPRGRTFLPPADSAITVWADDRAQAVSFDAPDSPRGRTFTGLSKRGGQVEIILHRTYVCGEERRRLGRFTAVEAINLLKAHRDWSASFDRTGRVIMEETIDDLSPECRETATIGLGANGMLSLFDGPTRKEKVIRTFFQMDIKSLESGLSKERIRELKEGIRVHNGDNYREVLSSLDDYASPSAAALVRPKD